MPVPEHLAPILDRLGDGGTTALAELIHTMMAEARAEERGQAPAAVTLQAQLDITRNDLARLRDGADPSAVPDDSWPTVGQLWHQLITTDHGDREERLARLLDAFRRQAREPLGAADPAQTAAPIQTPNVSFHCDTISELLGQLVGACSITRFWDEMPTNYPYGAGVFLENAASALVHAALAEHERLTSDRPEQERPDIHTLIERSSLGEPDAAAARARVPLEQAQAVVARDDELADTPDDDIDWGDNDADGQPLPEAVGDQLAATEGTPGPSNAEVRAWCQAHGVPVNAKGAVRADARAAYDAAHQGA